MGRAMPDSGPDIAKRDSVAILGGTFDPVHNGHLAVATAVRERFNLSEIILMPTGSSWLKSGRDVTGAEARYEMTRLAVAGDPGFSVSRMELERRGSTYTVDTVLELLGENENLKISLIVGSDILFEIPSWREPERLLKLCSLIAVARPGHDRKAVRGQFKFLKAAFDCRISLFTGRMLDISSTAIREDVLYGRSIKYLVPEGVERYISEHNLYRDMEFEAFLNSGAVRGYREAVRGLLSPYRYSHSLGVAEWAVRLARLNGADTALIQKAYIAGILHDLAKEFPERDMRDICEKSGGSPAGQISPAHLLHGFAAAAYAHEHMGVGDPDILEAMRLHTTGAPGMTLLGKLIFIADMTEPLRDYDGADELRALALKDMDGAVARALEMKMEFTREKGREVHPDAVRALEYYKRQAR